MTAADVVGTLGVTILLAAFAASSLGWVERKSPFYNGANALGAGLAGWASLQIPFWPFVVLEGAWMLVALAALVNNARKERGA